MREPEYVEVIAEYHQAGGIWDTNSVFTMHELHDALLQTDGPESKEVVEEVVGSIPWLAEAVSASRKSYLSNAAKKAAAQSKGKTGLKPFNLTLTSAGTS